MIQLWIILLKTNSFVTIRETEFPNKDNYITDTFKREYPFLMCSEVTTYPLILCGFGHMVS